MDILKRLNEKQIYVLNLIKSICKNKNIKAYLVGGAIRDVLLNKNVNDIDICMEEDPKLIIPLLKEHLIKCEYYAKFNTAYILFNNGVEIDLIRCRSEIYLNNGELPIIKPSNIKDDLYRRDFTINALAFNIVEESLIDLFGGLKDIKDGILRKVHKNSYKEDPTRIFRAIRYFTRYNLTFEDLDEVKENINYGVLDTISCDRIMKEVHIMCSEENWVDNAVLCGKLKIFNIDNVLIGKKNIINGFEDINVRVLNLFLSLKDNKQNYFINNSVLVKSLKNSMKNYRENKDKIIQGLNSVSCNYDIYKLLESTSNYERVLLAWDDKLKYKIINYNSMVKIKLITTGQDVIKIGSLEGKEIGQVLKYLLKIKLNTGIKNDEIYFKNNLGEIIDAIKYKN